MRNIKPLILLTSIACISFLGGCGGSGTDTSSVPFLSLTSRQTTTDDSLSNINSGAVSTSAEYSFLQAAGVDGTGDSNGAKAINATDYGGGLPEPNDARTMYIYMPDGTSTYSYEGDFFPYMALGSSDASASYSDDVTTSVIGQTSRIPNDTANNGVAWVVDANDGKKNLYQYRGDDTASHKAHCLGGFRAINPTNGTDAPCPNPDAGVGDENIGYRASVRLADNLYTATTLSDGATTSALQITSDTRGATPGGQSYAVVSEPFRTVYKKKASETDQSLYTGDDYPWVNISDKYVYPPTSYSHTVEGSETTYTADYFSSDVIYEDNTSSSYLTDTFEVLTAHGSYLYFFKFDQENAADDPTAFAIGELNSNHSGICALQSNGCCKGEVVSNGACAVSDGSLSRSATPLSGKTEKIRQKIRAQGAKLKQALPKAKKSHSSLGKRVSLKSKRPLSRRR